MSKLTRQDYEQAGRRAEELAEKHLRKLGYTIHATRYKTKEGEIDIIAQDADCLVIVEVKQRQNRLDAHESITRAAARRIDAATDIYVSDHPFAQNLGIRFDAVFVIGKSPLSWTVEHIIDAWRLD